MCRILQERGDTRNQEGDIDSAPHTRYRVLVTGAHRAFPVPDKYAHTATTDVDTGQGAAHRLSRAVTAARTLPCSFHTALARSIGTSESRLTRAGSTRPSAWSSATLHRSRGCPDAWTSSSTERSRSLVLVATRPTIRLE